MALGGREEERVVFDPGAVGRDEGCGRHAALCAVSVRREMRRVMNGVERGVGCCFAGK